MFLLFVKASTRSSAKKPSRLLLKAPDIVILDEATAHLDSASEAAIQQAFETALAGRTSIVIAHRLSTILKADQILVIENGRIVQRGTHAALVQQEGSISICTARNSPKPNPRPSPNPPKASNLHSSTTILNCCGILFPS